MRQMSILVAVTALFASLPAVDRVVAQGRQGIVGGLDGPGEEPVRPAPRRPDGRILINGQSIGDRGLWLPGRGGFANPAQNAEAIPYQPWALALALDRRRNQLEPHTRCKPSGISRQFLTPYGVEIVEIPELQRLYIFDIGGPHTYRTVYMDGRTHPADLTPSYYGHSIGWWDGDALVVDTTGFNEGFWMDRGGLPHTDQLRTVERLIRTDYGNMSYELTIDDPGAYTRTFDTRLQLRWVPGDELFEYVCQQANYAHELMVGEFERADRTSPIVP